MKNLNLSLMDVEEMSTEETQSINGGIAAWIVIGLILVAAAVVDYLQDGKVDGAIYI
jgi:lactobin A/cerein 7B family class IIb bacteriocin